MGCFAKNYCTIIVSRALAGVAGSPSVSVFAGVLNDMWNIPSDRLGVLAFVMYGLGGAIAPSLGPIVGESIVATYGWRSSFWLTSVLAGSCFPGMVFTPETFQIEIVRQEQNAPRRGLVEALVPALRRPLELLWFEPVIWPTALVVTTSQIVLFILYVSLPVVLTQTYQFSPYHVGLSFLPFMVGTLLAVPALAVQDRWKRSLRQPAPEDSLVGVKVAGILLPISLIWLGWTMRPTVHWIWPLLSLVAHGWSFAMEQLSYPVYKNEIYGIDLPIVHSANDRLDGIFLADDHVRGDYSCLYTSTVGATEKGRIVACTKQVRGP
ncbi:MFS general substrate transporter [Penicillium diatomitis]|uniref:MFS general substrate transporter n=1 Tax=Penicillium diatomitis TaxID=2819901 RepID=A0A9X0BM32_9EURO|nr:MFS general substrate transporter [Penicillium diatomitis]KAJ5472028.1 MFS general substrate transporter [Penicillium diatomitis]